ncbi:WbqC family protein [Endozoicomonas gorgoniicola]|uniref:WbqC family protein n=1 Tax=Endozoicomonas gorgoniicola TaxID=1234144 RepID=A0ABT3MPU2_9GAMM|nr:WbqC family protein [Endozoicomonas gorgoniicola]MCW7551389.1 WbqC family protein [Endozoicomonas gorgoniicola]
MRLGLMQPYFLPYIGYWQLINLVDHFIIYDDVQYIKQGWVNRNRYLNNRKPTFFTIPVSKGSMKDHMLDKKIQPQWHKKEADKFIKSLKQNYLKSDYAELIDFFEKIVLFQSSDMVEYLHNSITKVCELLDIDTKITFSSSLKRNMNLSGQKSVLDICKMVNANAYTNPIGGAEIYDKEYFEDSSVELSFIRAKPIEYSQLGKNKFVPYLSIIDMLFNCGIAGTKEYLTEYELL